MYRKSLVKGIAICLAAGTILTATVPAMADDNVSNIEVVSDSADIQTADTQAADTQAADTQAADAQTTDTADQQNAGETASVANASLISNDKGNKPACETTEEKDHPVYTASVSVKDGTLADDFNKDQIYFDGVFEGSEIQDVQVNSDRTGFTVKFTKACDSKETVFDGNMYIKGNSVLLADGSSASEDLSVYMYDTYRATETASTDDKKGTLDEAAWKKLLTDEENAAVEFIASSLLETVIPGKFSDTLIKWMQDQGLKFGADTNVPSEPSKELKAINALSLELSQSTKDILNGVEKDTLYDCANAINQTIDTMNKQYNNCKTGILNIQAWEAQNTLQDHQDRVDSYMETIYRFGNGNANIASSEMANFTVFNSLMSLGDAIKGQNGLFSTYNIFQINHGLSSYIHNYNTQTFQERRDFNQRVMNFYDEGYAAVKAAIIYDVAKNSASLEAYQKEITDIQNALTDNDTSDEVVEKAQKTIDALKAKIDVANDAVTEGNDKLEKLSEQRKDIQGLKNASDAEITTESDQPYVLCYRNGARYDKAMTVTESTPENYRSQDVNFMTADVGKLTESHYASGGDETYITIKDEWNGSDKDGWTCFADAAAYKGTTNTNMDYLAKIAQQRGLTLEQDLTTAFTVEGDASGVSGFYNGGKFTKSDSCNQSAYDGNYYLGEEQKPWPFQHFTNARRGDFYWYHIDHVVNYYTLGGKAATNTQTRSFSVCSGQYCLANFDNPGWCHESKSSGDNIKLFVVNLYE